MKAWPSRQPLLLFHSYLFDKQNIPGVAEMDILRAMGILRQLDVGSEETMLLAKDSASASLVLSFSELAYHLEETFEALKYQ